MTTADLCRTLRVSRGRQLNHATLHILAFLVEQGGQARLLEIAGELDVTSVTGTMKQLEKLGFAHRAGAHHDRRAIYAVITQQGRDEIARCIKSTAA